MLNMYFLELSISWSYKIQVVKISASSTIIMPSGIPLLYAAGLRYCMQRVSAILSGSPLLYAAGLRYSHAQRDPANGFNVAYNVI